MLANDAGMEKLGAAQLAGLPEGSWDVKITARNAIGLVLNDDSNLLGSINNGSQPLAQGAIIPVANASRFPFY
jgi:hypothetical protein